MKEIIFVTGNAEKARRFSQLTGLEIGHAPADLDEIQTTNHRELVEHKAREAYRQIGKPVLVEDVFFTCNAWGNLPGPFIKFYVEQPVGVEKICRMLDGFDDRRAEAGCIFGYFDGTDCTFFEGSIGGTVTDAPRGTGGYGYDSIFEVDGFGGKTGAELSAEEYEKYYTTIKPLRDVRKFITS